jgi:hypothetical protein
MIGFIAPYIFTTRDYRQYSAIADLHSLQFTVAYALSFSIFTSHILATELQESHCHFKSHEIFFSQPNPFLAIILDSVQFLCSLAHIPAGWRPESRSSLLDYCSLLSRKSEVKVTLRLTVSQSVSQSVLVSSPVWGSWPDIYYFLTATVLFLWGALSDESRVFCVLSLPLGTDHTENTASIINEACLPVVCLAMDVLLLHAYASRECV